ncbi:hypothetical protein HDZ31DRAFT_33615 [Schizophyllum fasciatum]
MSTAALNNYNIMKARFDANEDLTNEDLLASIDTSYIHSSCFYVDDVDYQIYKQRQQVAELAAELEGLCAIAGARAHEAPGVNEDDATQQHQSPAGGRSRKAAARAPLPPTRRGAIAMESSSDDSDSEGSTFSPIDSPCSSRSSTPERDILYEDPLSQEALQLAVLIATSGTLRIDDLWGESPTKAVNFNPFLQTADWYMNQDRDDDEYFTIYGDNGREEKINLSAEERRKQRRASQTVRRERVAKASSPYARPTARLSPRQRCAA